MVNLYFLPFWRFIRLFIDAMTTKETIQKSANEIEKIARRHCGCSSCDSDLLDALGFRDKVLLEAYKEELRGKLEKMKIPVESMSHDLRGNCDFERNNTINKILALINKKTEI